MTEEGKRKPGRPAGTKTGETPLRTAKIGATWDRAKELEAELAELEGRKANVSRYVEAAILEHNARVERQIAKLRASTPPA